MNNTPKLKPILRKRRPKRMPGSKVLDPPDPKQKQQLKFAGPIKIIVIEPKSEYCKTVWCAIGIGLTNVAIGTVNMSVLHYSLKGGDAHAILCCFAMYVFILNPSGEYCNVVTCALGIGLSQVLMGATLMAILMYSLKENFHDLHIILCSFAFHFCTAEAILSLHYANGWSTPMRLRHRKFAHFFLNVCGMSCALIGTVLVTIDKGISTEPHAITGLITGILVIVTAILGPCAYFIKKRPCVLTFHITFGIPAFIMSSICLCFGLFLKSFKDWAGGTVIYILLSFVVFYTVFIVTSSFMKCVSRI